MANDRSRVDLSGSAGTHRDGGIRYVGLTPSRDVEGKTEKKDLGLDT